MGLYEVASFGDFPFYVTDKKFKFFCYDTSVETVENLL